MNVCRHGQIERECEICCAENEVEDVIDTFERFKARAEKERRAYLILALCGAVMGLAMGLAL